MGAQEKLYQSYSQWNDQKVYAKEGLLVGSDVTQEWLLPWWWERYQKYNHFPVAFVNFGLSESMKAWCRERGVLLSLPVDHFFVKERQEIDPSLIESWEMDYGKEFWPSRNAWFKKPLACLLSPYEKTIWMDSDCEIRGFLGEAFKACNHPSGSALAIKGENMQMLGSSLNSGVIVFKRGAKLIEKWAKMGLECNDRFAGDDNLLSTLIRSEKLEIGKLPLIYNWSRCDEEAPENVIVKHWHGRHGKQIIRHQIARSNLVDFLNE